MKYAHMLLGIVVCCLSSALYGSAKKPFPVDIIQIGLRSIKDEKSVSFCADIIFRQNARCCRGIESKTLQDEAQKYHNNYLYNTSAAGISLFWGAGAWLCSAMPAMYDLSRSAGTMRYASSYLARAGRPFLYDSVGASLCSANISWQFLSSGVALMGLSGALYYGMRMVFFDNDGMRSLLRSFTVMKERLNKHFKPWGVTLPPARVRNVRAIGAQDGGNLGYGLLKEMVALKGQSNHVTIILLGYMDAHNRYRAIPLWAQDVSSLNAPWVSSNEQQAGSYSTTPIVDDQNELLNTGLSDLLNASVQCNNYDDGNPLPLCDFTQNNWFTVYNNIIQQTQSLSSRDSEEVD